MIPNPKPWRKGHFCREKSEAASPCLCAVFIEWGFGAAQDFEVWILTTYEEWLRKRQKTWFFLLTPTQARDKAADFRSCTGSYKSTEHNPDAPSHPHLPADNGA